MVAPNPVQAIPRHEQAPIVRVGEFAAGAIETRKRFPERLQSHESEARRSPCLSRELRYLALRVDLATEHVWQESQKLVSSLAPRGEFDAARAMELVDASSEKLNQDIGSIHCGSPNNAFG